MEPPSTCDARPLRRHGEDLVRHGDAVEEEERARDGPYVSDGLARRRWLVAVEASAYEPHTRVRDRCEGRRRHAGRAAAAHSARRVVKYALAVLVFPQEHWHLALFAPPSHLHVACVKSTSESGYRVDGVDRLNLIPHSTLPSSVAPTAWSQGRARS